MEYAVGFIGLGVMGGAMARRLLERCGRLVVHDVDAERVRALERLGATPAPDAAAVGSAAEVVVLSLPDSATVKSVILGVGGLAGGLRAGGTVIDTSTTEPGVTVEIARELQDRGLRFLDAPVSGGEKGAVEGTLSIMVGGEPAVFEECRELLVALGTTVVRVGDSGMGQVAKVANQMIVGATFAVVAEAFALATKCGLNPKVLYEAIRNGWAGSRVLDVAAPAMLERNFRPGGTVNIHYKDLGYALGVAREQDVPLPITASAHEVFKAARAAGKGTLSQPAVVTLWEQLLGIEVT